ncbi:MAG: FAD-binding protein [Desulfovibrio sp.]|uniref:FAD-dependent oxidoreductase n=1 Tax=Desulfovibrio sp. TaxID=885 RepID=UPI001A7B764C|nr:FAD-binding protein [Desulfovibrio sp.]MBD5417315.1 FAD-binding protein [Desulfovibrio sp.]
MKSDVKINRVETDLLILGGGSAGLWAAHRFSELMPGRKVTIVDKGPQDWGGLMTMAGGDFEAVLPPDTVDEWLEDLVYYFDGLCDQPLMEALLARSADRMRDYERFGCEFFHTPDGRLKSVPQRGLPHVKLYPAQQKGRGGELMAKSLVARLKDAGVTRMGRIMLTDYLVRDGRVVGAVGFHCRTGEAYIFKAGAVIAATGMGGWKTSYGKNTPTGEGMQMAFEAGAELQDLEFCRVWNMPRLFAWEGQTHLFPLGARFVNRLGENFMSRYSPILGPNTDPHFTTIGMALEIRAGRGPIIFDVSPLRGEDMILLKPQTGWQKLNYDKLCKLGLDLFKDNTEWVPQMTVSHGGIRAGIDGSTAVAGLFAAGTARSLEPGVYAGGFALMTTAVTGHMVGETAAAWLKDAEGAPALDESEAMARLDRAYAPLARTGADTLTPKEVLTKLQAAVFPYDVSIVKNGPALEKALAEIRRIQAEELPRMAAADSHYLLKLHEVNAIAFVSELYVRASLERKETRAGHFREDYPHMDPAGPAWFFIRHGSDGKPEFVRERVPLEKWKVPLTRCYQDNFNFVEARDAPKA